MPTPYKDLEFSMYQTLILLRLKYFKIKKDKVTPESDYEFLLKYNLVTKYKRNNTFYVLNDKARMYLRYKRKDKIRFWIPVIISIIALFAGYDVYTSPLLARVLQAIATLVRTISENLGAFF